MAHENVLPCFGVLEMAGSLFVVSPYMQNGSLDSYVRRNPGADREQLVSWLPGRPFRLHPLTIRVR